MTYRRAVERINMPSTKGAVCSLFVALFSLCIVFLSISLAPTVAYAEGSRNLVSQGGYRPYVEQYGSSSAGESRLTEIGVYVKEGESLYFGSSVKKASLGLTNEKMGTELSEKELANLNDNCIIVCTPGWDKENNPQAYPYVNGVEDTNILLFRVDRTAEGGLRGYISNYSEEQAGPRTAKGESGYLAQAFIADTEGIYRFKFYSADESTQDPLPTMVGEEENFEVNQGSSTVAAWDISVLGKEGGWQTGRVFVDELYLNMGGLVPGQDVLMSTVYVLTVDGYEYQVDFNGIDPSTLRFFGNSRGLLQETKIGYQSLNHSVKSTNRALSDLVDNHISNNIKPTEEDVDKTHRIFLDQPDNYVLERYTGSDELSRGELSTLVEELEFTPALNPNKISSGTIIGSGGTFSFENDGSIEGSSFQITLDFSNAEQPDNKLVLSNSLVSGTNSVFWDGRDRYGKVVDVGVYNKDILVEIKGGEAHFPLIDVDNSRGGIKVTLLNEIETVADKTRVYYDNLSSKTDYAGAWGEENWTLADGLDASRGVSSENGILAFPDGAGAYTVIDVWAYQSESVIVPASFEVYRGEMSFAVSFNWDTAGDTAASKPVEGDIVNLQLQWRVKGSEETWTDYRGNQVAYHGAIEYITQSEYDPAAPSFTGLERYAGPNMQGEDSVYQYRVVASGVAEGYLLEASTFEAFDVNGVAYAVDLDYSYAPEKGTMVVYKKWEGDESANDVRPEQIRVSVLYRSAGSDDAWRQLITSEDDALVLSVENGWANELTLVCHDAKGTALEYCVAETAYSMSDNIWTELWTSGQTPASSISSEEGKYNAPGYSLINYQVDNGASTVDWSETFNFGPDKTTANIRIADTYRTSLTVSHAWETGTSSSAKPPVIVQLQKDGVDVEGETIDLTEEKSSHTFTELEIGHRYSTRVVSENPNYRMVKNGITGEDGYSLLNGRSRQGYLESYTSTFDLTSFTVEKKWSDSANHDPVTIELDIVFSDGREMHQETIDLSKENDWEYTFRRLPTGGNILVHEVTEVEGYASVKGALSGSNLSGYAQTIENTKTKTSISVTKNWKDDAQASDVRPDAVQIKILYRTKGSSDSWREFSNSSGNVFELSSFNRWNTEIKVDRYDQDGREIEYIVEEFAYKAAGTSYFTSMDKNDYATGYTAPVYSLNAGPESDNRSVVVDFKNDTTAEVVVSSTYTTSFTVVIAWQQGTDSSSLTTSEVTLQLQKDGEDVPGEQVVLKENDDTHVFTELETGHAYTVVEVSVPEGYEGSYTAVEGEDGYSSIGNASERGYYQGVTNTEVASLQLDAASETATTKQVIVLTLAVFATIAFAAGLTFLVVTIRKRK